MFMARDDGANLLRLHMFLGNLAFACEDNILTLINELFTGRFPPVKSGFSALIRSRRQPEPSDRLLAGFFRPDANRVLD